MTSLSWLLYLGEVCNSLKGSAALLAILLGIGSAFALGAYFVSDGEFSIPKAWGNRAAILFGFALSAAILTPTQQTIYLIAASEVGQQVAQSDTGKAVTDEVRKLILKKLQKLNEAAQ